MANYGMHNELPNFGLNRHKMYIVHVVLSISSIHETLKNKNIAELIQL